MHVLKFGGSSVGTAASLEKVKTIVNSCNDTPIVVVSALGGVTDMLLDATARAENRDKSYLDVCEKIRKRHMNILSELGLDVDIMHFFTELGSLLNGIYTLGVAPEKTRDQIVSFGERLSARIVSALISGSKIYDSLDFIKTSRIEGKDMLEAALTEELVKETFGKGPDTIAVVPGFISTDAASGEIRNLGRGGSDYTASIIAAALDAERLEIWTDVDGFMTADPRIINTSYVIDELSFAEAMELCNFGAKVIYAPALYPVCPKDIPLYIRNTFNPGAKGTIIRRHSHNSGRTVTGITSIDNICMLTLSGPSMVGIIGVDSRLFKALSENKISVFLVSQSSSETGISVGISADKAALACEAIDKEFAIEIAQGSMNRVSIGTGLAAVAVVGEDMKHSKGVAGKLFTILGRNGIGVLACAQGSSKHNISMIIESSQLKKALNVIHDSFFLSEYQELNIFVCGVGTVGGSLLDQISSQREKLMYEHNLKMNVVGIARSSKGIFDRNGIDLTDWRDKLQSGKPMTPEVLKEEVIGMNIFNPVFVDCTASEDVAALYGSLLENNISVVAANKVAASSEYDIYSGLKAVSIKKGVKFLFETNVGAGLPIINTINALRNSGDRIEKIEAVLSGTLNFIFNTISEDIPFSKAVRMAKEQGFSEPDPRIDLSGKDVIRKLVILAREAGYKVEQQDVKAELFIPAEFFNCTLDEFWERLPSLDADFERRRKKLEAGNRHWRFVAEMENGKYSVSLREFESNHSFYVLEGSNNIILLTTERYNRHPMLIQGYGAGAAVTAAGVFADIMSIANI